MSDASQGVRAVSGGRELAVVEPHLRGNAGHYGEFVRALAERGGSALTRIHVHGGAGVEDLALLRHPRIVAHSTFAHASRKAEWQFLARFTHDCPDRNARVLVLTARAAHAAFLEAFGDRRTAELERYCLYFHWRERSLAQRAMQVISRRVRRRVLAIAPTPTTAAFLRSLGWERVHEVPYPMLPPAEQRVAPADQPARLLVAGAMRMNKGLRLITELNDRLRTRPVGVPLLIQSSGKRDGRHGGKESATLARLERSAWDGLILDPTAPDSQAYGARFVDALTLTPYDPERFADNVSGVALDALLRGSPIIAPAGSWQARLIEGTGAGIVMRAWDTDSLEAAVRDAVTRWRELSAAARQASIALAATHDPAHLARVLVEE